jgi:hypothetical protein
MAQVIVPGSRKAETNLGSAGLAARATGRQGLFVPDRVRRGFRDFGFGVARQPREQR